MTRMWIEVEPICERCEVKSLVAQLEAGVGFEHPNAVPILAVRGRAVEMDLPEAPTVEAVLEARTRLPAAETVRIARAAIAAERARLAYCARGERTAAAIGEASRSYHRIEAILPRAIYLADVPRVAFLFPWDRSGFQGSCSYCIEGPGIPPRPEAVYSDIAWLTTGKKDERGTVHQIGWLLFEMVTGVRQNVYDIEEVIRRRYVEPPPRVRQACPGADASPALEALIERALDPDPAKRPPTLEALDQALAAAVKA